MTAELSIQINWKQFSVDVAEQIAIFDKRSRRFGVHQTSCSNLATREDAIVSLVQEKSEQDVSGCDAYTVGRQIHEDPIFAQAPRTPQRTGELAGGALFAFVRSLLDPLLHRIPQFFHCKDHRLFGLRRE